MVVLVYLLVVFKIYSVTAVIRDSAIVNKLTNIKPVGSVVARSFAPLTELPPPHGSHHHHGGRRHLDDCDKQKQPKQVYEGAKVAIFGDYYEDRQAKTMATVIIPDHIDTKHFEVTTQVPYLTVGAIEAIGYHPSTIKSDHPSECEKIYQDHIADQYSDEDTDYSEESLEMARLPLVSAGEIPASLFEEINSNIYNDNFK